MADYFSTFTFLYVHTGFYRVNYDPTNWRLLISSFQHLPDVTRAQLLDDALNLALSGRLQYSIALDLTSQLIRDVEYLPWSAALTALEHLDTMLALTPAYGNFKVCVIGSCVHVSVLVNLPMSYDIKFLPSPGVEGYLNIKGRKCDASCEQQSIKRKSLFFITLTLCFEMHMESEYQHQYILKSVLAQ
jgi:hypothetical protein